MSRSLEFPAILGIVAVAVTGSVATFHAIAGPSSHSAPVEAAAQAVPPAAEAAPETTTASAPAADPAPAAAAEPAAETTALTPPADTPAPAANAVTEAEAEAPAAEAEIVLAQADAPAETTPDPAPSTTSAEPTIAREPLGLGRTALPEEILAWDVAVLPDGQGLREGSGDVATGEEVFVEYCGACHGDFAEGIDSWPVLAGGIGSLTNQRPVKTVGSYWPYLSTVYDYIHRSMPFGAAQTLSVDDTYAITAYLLYSNGVVEDDFVLTHENFTEITLPNAAGFYVDDRAESEYPLFSGEPCMTDCGPAPQVTRRAVDLGVTPTDADGRPAGTMPVIDLPATAESGEPAAPAEMTAQAETVTETPAEPAPETQTGAPAAEPESEPEQSAGLDPALVAAGETQFRKCAACHKVGEGAANGVGPQLNGIVGRVAGTTDGFRYSKPMTDAGAEGLVWDADSLHSFLENPRGFIPRNRMSYNGLKNEEDRTALIAYLSSLTE
ncbi:c-type cytochrome [Szabonella alba]|uniref:C-type cytochrome n=1 Tax=Szabonella alba TaxID=2804194 RepID=A0A8K0XZ80_9RHOB|nr:c-type cytochrome [Szabonella alba]MBL4916501.1 c-type cytochrome [Szabonella alba]